MTLVVPPGFLNCSFILTGAVGTQPYVTTMGFEYDTGATTPEAAANGIFIAYATHLMPETSNLLTLDRVSCYVGDDGPSGSVDSDEAPVAGSATAARPPTACSAIARKVTAERGRRGRGRMFLPGVLAETEIDQDGTVTAGRRTSLNTALDDFQDTFVAGVTGVTGLVLLHSSAPADPSPITGLVTSDLVGWIRGRIR